MAFTEGVHNVDDLSTLALVMRAAAMRELGNFTAASEVLKEALRFPSRSAGVRHRGPGTSGRWSTVRRARNARPGWNSSGSTPKTPRCRT